MHMCYGLALNIPQIHDCKICILFYIYIYILMFADLEKIKPYFKLILFLHRKFANLILKGISAK